jgi:hypothetical protein
MSWIDMRLELPPSTCSVRGCSPSTAAATAGSSAPASRASPAAAAPAAAAARAAALEKSSMSCSRRSWRLACGASARPEASE